MVDFGFFFFARADELAALGVEQLVVELGGLKLLREDVLEASRDFDLDAGLGRALDEPVELRWHLLDLLLELADLEHGLLVVVVEHRAATLLAGQQPDLAPQPVQGLPQLRRLAHDSC